MATDRIIFKVHGEKQLFSRLNSLDRKLKRRIATKAIRAGAKVQVAALRSATPRDSGAARKAIGTKVKTYRNSGITVAITGERYTKAAKDGKETKAKFGGPHLHLIEYGTQERHWTGEKTARQDAAIYTARFHAGKKDSASFLHATLAKSGSFGRQEVVGWNFRKTEANQRLVFSTNIRKARRQSSTFLRRLRLSRAQRSLLKDVRSGKNTGRMPARPFFRRVVMASAAAARAALIAVLRREIPAEARSA